MKAYSLANCTEFITCLSVCVLHEILLPYGTSSKTPGEHKIKLIRNLILLAEFVFIRLFHLSLIIDLFILFIIVLLILPSFTKVIFAKDSDFVIISCAKPNPQISSAKYKWLMSKSQELDLGTLKKINHTIKPDFLLLHEMPVDKIRKLLLHRENRPVFCLKNGKMEKLSAVDILKSSSLYVEKQYIKDPLILFPENSMDKVIKEQATKHNVKYTEFTPKYANKVDPNNFKHDAIVDLTCLNGSYRADRFESITKLLAQVPEVEFMMVTPIFFQDKQIEIKIRTYEVMLQQYPNVRILRIPFVLYDKIKINMAVIQNWSRIDDLFLYLNYAMSIRNQKIIELNDGEYFFNKDLQKLLEEIHRI